MVETVDPDPAAKPETVVDGGPIAVIERRDGMGQVLTAHAMEQAISRSNPEAADP